MTTNPSLIAKEGIKGERAINGHYQAICPIAEGGISAEVLSKEFNTITDLWTGKVMGTFTGELAPAMNRHGAGLYRIASKK